MRRNYTKLVLVFLVVIALASLAACTNAAPTTQQPPAQAPNATATKPANPTGSGAPTTKPGVTTAPQASASPTPVANTVFGDGTVTVATYSNLYFGTAGQIAKINVKQGDRVAKGSALAKLDTTSLEAALALAKVNLDQSKIAQTQALSALATAQFNLDRTLPVTEIKDAITNAQWTIKAAQVSLDQAKAANDAAGVNSMTAYINSAQKDLLNQTNKLKALLAQSEYAGVDTTIYTQTYDRLTVQDAKIKQLAVDSAQQSVDKSQSTINQAQKNLDLAQLQLNQATIIAPFDGLVAILTGNEGDVLAAPSPSQKPVVYLVDTSTLEIIIGVNELDVPKVKIGQKAAVSIDAFPGVKIAGQVTAISPSPVVQGGIVDYQVTIAYSAPSNVDTKVGMNGSALITVN